ncbi:MAG: tetratricopeptide repeat protein [Candidatus Aureabacteria bacterium]|nr:tetratricopeptide repeat protein [Candidatus Auribacterota bacterium]
MDNLLSRVIRAGLIIILIALPLIYSSQTQNSFGTPKRAFFQIAVAALLVLFSLQMIVTPARLTSRGTPLDMVLLAWIAWEAVSSAHSCDRMESMRELIYSASTVAFFFLITRNVGERTQALSLIGVIVAMGVLEASYGIPERLGLKLLYESRVKETLSQAEVLAVRGSILGTFGNANQLASYLVLTCPLLLGIISMCRGVRRALLIASLAIVLTCLTLTGARGSWIAAFTGLFVFILWGARRNRRDTLKATGFTLLLFALVFMAVTNFKPQIAHELTGRLKGSFASLNYRLLTWRLSLRMIAHHPLLGSGPGTFKLLFLPALADYLRGLDPLSCWGLTEKMNEVHNEYLQLAVETGLPGLGFLLLFCGGAIHVALRALRKLPPSAAILSAALMASLAAVMADAATSISFHVVPTRVAFWAVAAILLSLPNMSSVRHPAELRARASPAISRLAVTPYLAISLIFSYITISSSLRDIAFEYYFKIATNLTHMGRYHEAIPFFQGALRVMPSSGQVKFYYGSTLVQLGRDAEGAAALEESKNNFQDIYLFKNLGLAYERLGQPERAVEQYLRWREMGIASHEANNRIALIQLRQGRAREAEGLFKDTLRVRPWDWVAYSSLGSLYLESGRTDEAIRVLQNVIWKIPDSFTLYGTALLKAGRYEEARQNLLHALSMDPRSVRAHNNLGTLHRKTAKRDDAIKEWEEVLRMDPDNIFAKSNLEDIRKKGR